MITAFKILEILRTFTVNPDEFAIRGDRYGAYIHLSQPIIFKGEEWDVDGSYEGESRNLIIAFRREHRYSPPETTGLIAGESAHILLLILQKVREMVRLVMSKYLVYTIKFSSINNDPKREKLYDHLAQKLAQELRGSIRKTKTLYGFPAYTINLA